jgi:hypothetical protein
MLKERLRSDLTDAIKDRDKVRSGTIRMVLTAITEAEGRRFGGGRALRSAGARRRHPGGQKAP